MSIKRELEQTEDEEDSTEIIKKHAKEINHVPLMQDKDDFILVWCRDQPALDDIVETLQPLCHDIHYYQDSTSCISYINSLNAKQQVFLIVPASFTSLEEIHSKRQVDTIFIYEREVTQLSNSSVIDKYSKAITVFGDLNDLVESISKTGLELAKYHQVFNIYNHKQKALCNLSESSSSFLWSQLFKNMLIDSSKDSEQNETDRIDSKKNMIQRCYDYYRHNSTQMKNISDFEINYQTSNAIRWYTGDSFIYKLINKALRTEDIEVLHTFRFFIIDLCINLAEKHKKMLDLDVNLPSIVYRGTQMTKEEIDSLKENESCLIATNGFLSTTRDYNVAKMFAGSGVMSSRRRGELHAVVFELELSTSVKSAVFADISDLSKMVDEQEVLFDIGTTFIITSVVMDETEHNWIVRLTTTDKGHDIVTKEYIDFYRERMSSYSPTVKLGELLIITGQYENARVYFNDLLKLHDQDIVHILYNLAWIDHSQGKYLEARKKLNTAYDKETTSESPCQRKLRDILIDIGINHVVMSEYEEGLSCYRQAEQTFPSPSIFNNIGLAYKFQGRYDDALEYFNKAIDLYKSKWPDGHHRIGITMDNIGRVYNNKGEHSKALEYHLEGLQIKLQTLPEDHMDVGISFNNVGFTYDDLGQYDKALTYYQRALDVYQKCLPEIHHELGILFDNMALAYRCNKQFDECFKYHHRALYIKERIEPINRLSLAQTLNNLGVALVTYKQDDEDNDQEALNYFQRALAMHDANGSAKSSDAAITLYRKGTLHDRRQEYQQAHDAYTQALKIQQCILPGNHSAILKTQTAMNQLKLKFNQSKN